MPYEGPVNSQVLNFDPLDTAEKVTGKSYKDDRDTSLLGLALFTEHNSRKKKLLSESCDTYHGQTLSKYLEVVLSLGFQEAIKETFKGHSDDREETYFIFWHPSGVLLSFDTYLGEHVNGGHLYYNWSPAISCDDYYSCLSSGSGADVDGRLVWTGYHDCREALRFNFVSLQDKGTFLNPWEKCPFLWLGHYMDHKDKEVSYVSINDRYIDKLPKYVYNAIAPSWKIMSKGLIR